MAVSEGDPPAKNPAAHNSVFVVRTTLVDNTDMTTAVTLTAIHDPPPPPPPTPMLFQHVGGERGDGDCSPVFVKVMTSKDRWNRSGWCFETLCDKDGSSVPVLERTSPPVREVRTGVAADTEAYLARTSLTPSWFVE